MSAFTAGGMVAPSLVPDDCCAPTGNECVSGAIGVKNPLRISGCFENWNQSTSLCLTSKSEVNDYDGI